MRRPIPTLRDLMGAPRKAAPPTTRTCDAPGCGRAGEHRAPKDRSLSAYYWFCLDHVRDYNKAWNYYEGMTEDDIELHLRNDTCWQRPTWPLGGLAARMAEAARKGRVGDPFKVFDDEPAGSCADPRPSAFSKNGPEAQAMRVMDLEEPLTVEEVKTRYRVLVKRHHPDANIGDADAEERFKRISEAYRVLMKALQTA